MRIHLPLRPEHFVKPSAGTVGTNQGPLASIGGELVLLELQGELSWEGDQANGVVGILGLDRPDRPTLHIGSHHLLHGKVATLPRPYAVIRRARGDAPAEGDGDAEAIEGDAEDEESDEEREALEAHGETPDRPRSAKRARRESGVEGGDKGKGSGKQGGGGDGEGNEDGDGEDADEGVVFPEDTFTTPARVTRNLPSLPPSSPMALSSAAPDYSSDLSSPVSAMDGWGFPKSTTDDEMDVEEEEDTQAREDRQEREAEHRRKLRRANRPPRERTRQYEVVGVVRKKLVFALRPEPLVTATPLPE